MKTAVRSLLLLTTLLLVGCSALNTVDFGDLDPINPDPNDPLDELLYEGYVLYTNVDNTIVKLDPADPTASELVISNVDADTPTFYITEDDDGDTCAVFGRSTDADGNAGPFVAIKNMDTGDEVILTDSYASHGVDREFIVVGGDVIYSSNGNLKSFNIATGDPAVGGDAIISNASSYVCSHFPQYFADGVITFAEHVPGEIAGTLHMVKYEPPTAQPVDFLKSIYYEDVEFGSLFYPMSYNETDLMSISVSSRTNILRQINVSGGFSGQATVTCSDTIEAVEFNKAYQTADPAGDDGPLTILYGYNSVYWFEDIPTSNGDFEVSGKDFLHNLDWVYATDDGKYIAISTEHGIWLYDRDFNQLYSEFEYLNQERRVLWVDIQ